MIVALIISIVFNVLFVIRISQLHEENRKLEKSKDYYKSEYDYCWNYIFNENMSDESKVFFIKSRMEEIPF